MRANWTHLSISGAAHCRVPITLTWVNTLPFMKRANPTSATLAEQSFVRRMLGDFRSNCKPAHALD